MGLTFKGTAVKRCVFKGQGCTRVYYNGTKVFDVLDFLKDLKVTFTIEKETVTEEDSSCPGKNVYVDYYWLTSIKITHNYEGAVICEGSCFINDTEQIRAVHTNFITNGKTITSVDCDDLIGRDTVSKNVNCWLNLLVENVPVYVAFTYASVISGTYTRTATKVEYGSYNLGADIIN